jgi:hypothetical protein
MAIKIYAFLINPVEVGVDLASVPFTHVLMWV